MTGKYTIVVDANFFLHKTFHIGQKIKTGKPHLMRKVGEICYETNRHSYESRFVIDPVITMLSLVYKLQLTVRS